MTTQKLTPRVMLHMMRGALKNSVYTPLNLSASDIYCEQVMVHCRTTGALVPVTKELFEDMYSPEIRVAVWAEQLISFLDSIQSTNLKVVK